jgi:integrase
MATKKTAKPNVTKLPVPARNPKVLITNKTAKSYRPRQKEYYIRDTKLQGFYIRVPTQSRKTYCATARLRGKKTLVTISPTDLITAGQARKRAEEILRDLKLGIDPRLKPEKKTDRTFEAVTKEYVSKRDLKESTIKDYLSRLPRNMAMLWKKDLEDISLDDMHKWWRGKDKGKHQALRYLSTVCEFAKRRRYIEHNIASEFRADIGGIKAQPPRTKSVRQHLLPMWVDSFVQQSVPHPKFYDETTKTYPESPKTVPYGTWWNKKPTIHDTQRDYILFLLLTGKRREESAKLKWEDLDWSNTSIPTLKLSPEITKQGRPDEMPMTDLIGVMLRYRANRPNRHEEYVFENFQSTSHIKNPYRSLFKISNYEQGRVSIGNSQARYEDKGNTVYTPHDLRRTLRSVGGNLGYSNIEMKEVLAHTKGDITEDYFVERFYTKERERLNHIDDSILQKWKWWMMVFWYDKDESWLDQIDPREDTRELLPYFDRFDKPTEEIGHPEAPYRLD